MLDEALTHATHAAMSKAKTRLLVSGKSYSNAMSKAKTRLLVSGKSYSNANGTKEEDSGSGAPGECRAPESFLILLSLLL